MNNTIIIAILLILIFYFHYTCKFTDKFDPENTNMNFADFTDYSQPVEMEPPRSQYNSKPAWDDFHNKILTIVGGDSIRKFESGRKFRLISTKRTMSGNLADGNRSNQPFVYMETSSDGINWDLHPQYSVPGDSINFNYNEFTLDSPGGTLKCIRYPNGRLWIGNEGGQGDLHTIELTDLNVPFSNELDIDYPNMDIDKKNDFKIDVDREPGLNSNYDSNDALDTPSALSSNNSIL